jgi:hypothetical protein
LLADPDQKESPETMSRFARQIQLEEVGLLGQGRIEETELYVTSDWSKDERYFARIYAERCGLIVATEESQELRSARNSLQYPFEIAALFRHEQARAVGVGAATAQTQVVRALSFK